MCKLSLFKVSLQSQLGSYNPLFFIHINVNRSFTTWKDTFQLHPTTLTSQYLASLTPLHDIIPLSKSGPPLLTNKSQNLPPLPTFFCPPQHTPCTFPLTTGLPIYFIIMVSHPQQKKMTIGHLGNKNCNFFTICQLLIERISVTPTPKWWDLSGME